MGHDDGSHHAPGASSALPANVLFECVLYHEFVVSRILHIACSLDLLCALPECCIALSVYTYMDPPLPPATLWQPSCKLPILSLSGSDPELCRSVVCAPSCRRC